MKKAPGARGDREPVRWLGLARRPLSGLPAHRVYGVGRQHRGVGEGDVVAVERGQRVAVVGHGGGLPGRRGPLPALLDWRCRFGCGDHRRAEETEARRLVGRQRPGRGRVPHHDGYPHNAVSKVRPHGWPRKTTRRLQMTRPCALVAEFDSPDSRLRGGVIRMMHGRRGRLRHQSGRNRLVPILVRAI